MEPIEALSHLGGAARWADLIDFGVPRGALAGAVKRGAVVRKLFGTYALPQTPRGVWLAAAFNSVESCVSLCEREGLPMLRHPSKVHLVVPESRGLSSRDSRPTGRVVLHRSDACFDEAADNPVAVALDVASQCVDRYGQLALVDAALKAGTLFRANIHNFHQTPPHQRRWLANHCDHESQSIMESYARVWLTEAGFWVRPQVVVKPRGHRDLLVEGRVVVDLDGWETHGNPESFREDRRLDRLAIHDGKITLRYTYDDLFGRERADLVADVEAALRVLRKSI